MRKRFEQQLSMGIVPIKEVKFEGRTRHQLPPLLQALQYVFATPALNQQVFVLLESKILKGKKRTGRLGMSLWEILVLSLVRLNLDIDYDFLLNTANHHEQVRGILGVHQQGFMSGKHYKYQTLLDNVSLLDEETIRQINELIVEHAHGLIKKKEAAEALALNIKVDSYAVERTVHFPTDLNLTWDSGRKCLAVVGKLRKEVSLSGWGKLNFHYNTLRKVYRKASEIHRKKGTNYHQRLKTATEEYLQKARVISEKVKKSLLEGATQCQGGKFNIKQFGLLQELNYYREMLDKHIDLVERRIIKGEKIPHGEKVFSIFEKEVEWLNKGKQGSVVELGHNVSIATSQYQYIMDFEIMIKTADPAAGLALGVRISEKYKVDYTLASISFDRGYYSTLVKKRLSKDYKEVIMPKRGKKTKKQEAEESEASFQKLRKAHSTVESNINQLEHHGVNRCPDKGLKAFKRYVALGILSYNLHKLGLLLKKMEVPLAKAA